MPNKRLCKGCNKYKVERGSNPIIKWCSPKCKEIVIKATLEKVWAKGKKKERQKNAKLKRDYYENHIPTQKAKATKAFNAYIRARDRGDNCISCGKSMDNCTIDAGHYIAAGKGLSGSLHRYDENNVHAQCHWDCNIQQSGNLVEYRQGLIKKIGEEEVERLETTKGTIKRTAQDYKDIEVKYKAKLKEITSG